MLVYEPHPSYGIVPYPLGAGQKERPKYPEKSLSDNNSWRMGETPTELPFIGDQVVRLSHNQAARRLLQLAHSASGPLRRRLLR